MSSVWAVELPILSEEHNPIGCLVIQCLKPERGPATLLDRRGEANATPGGIEPVQLLESAEYAFLLRLDVPGERVTTDRPELFDADPGDGRRGRLRTRLFVGTVRVRVFLDGRPLGVAAFEVRSRKLNYLEHYRWMLCDIADLLSELIMQRFAPSAHSFALDDRRDARTLYQRFAFVASLVSSDRVENALVQIFARPHRIWRDVESQCAPGERIPMSHSLARQLARPGRGRVLLPGDDAGFASLPAEIRLIRHEESVDTAENRFVKFVLGSWLTLTNTVAQALRNAEPTTAARRGLVEAEELSERLSIQLGSPFFRAIGALTHLPIASVTLQQRAGYREFFRFFLQTEAAAAIRWEGGEDVYGAGQRDIATLYEYWTFLQIVKILSVWCEGVESSDLIAADADGLSLRLVRGRRSALRGEIRRLGRVVRLELTFNQHFGRDEPSSWSLQLRPDISLRIDVDGGRYGPTWLHFDAKYRIDGLSQEFTAEPDADTSRAQRGDIAKMHAYRDAIRGSVGAFVVYPGQDVIQCPTYSEILPGIGAFGLRPTSEEAPDGARALATFLDDALWLIASQYTQLERTRHWLTEVNRGLAGVLAIALPFLDRPPADVDVVLFRTTDGPLEAEIRRSGGIVLRTTGVPVRLLAAPFILWIDVHLQCELHAVNTTPERHPDGYWIPFGDELNVPAYRVLAERACHLLGDCEYTVACWLDVMPDQAV